MTKMKTGFFFVVTVLAVILCVVTRYPLFAQESVSSKSKVASLLRERRDTLKARVEIIEKLVGIVRSTPEALIAAREDLCNAEIEMATSKSERLAALQRKLENAKQLEAVMELRKQEARGTEAEILMAKAARLGVEVELQLQNEP